MGARLLSRVSGAPCVLSSLVALLRDGGGARARGAAGACQPRAAHCQRRVIAASDTVVPCAPACGRPVPCATLVFLYLAVCRARPCRPQENTNTPGLFSGPTAKVTPDEYSLFLRHKYILYVNCVESAPGKEPKEPYFLPQKK